MKVTTINASQDMQTNAAGSAQSGGTSKQYVIKDINSLAPGDQFKAIVKDIQPNQVVLKLQDGSSLTAKSLVLPDAHIGDESIFMVTENFKGQILLELVKPDGKNQIPGESVIREALEAAGAPLTEESKFLVKALMENNMPINAETLQKAFFLKYEIPGIDISKIIFLLKENITPTKENVAIFNELTTHSAKIGNMVSDVVDELILLFDNSKQQEVALQVSNEKTPNFEKELLSILLKKDFFISDDVKSEGRENGIFSQSANAKSKFDMIAEKVLYAETPEIKKEAVNILSNELKQKLFAIIEDMKQKGLPIEKYYQTLDEALSEMQTVIVAQGADKTPLFERITDLRENITFLQNIQNTKQYFHIPFIANGTENTGELHVMKDGKNKNLQRNANVLLALDFAELGHIDVFINKNEMAVTLQFKAADKTLKSIAQNAPELANSLNAKGFAVSRIGYEVLKKPSDIATLPIRDEQKKQRARYSFDMNI